MAAPMFTVFGRIVRRQIAISKCNYRRVLVVNIDISGFHTDVSRNGKNPVITARRLEAFLSKKKAWKSTDQLELVRPPVLTPGIKGKRVPPHASIRLKTHNTIVYEYIKDVINSNAISEELQNLQVEIVAVRYTGDMGTCRVFWKATGTAEEDSKIQNALNKYAPNIRHHLISQNILGKIPQLCFLVDKATTNAAEVERLLTIADFGPADEEGDNLSTPSDAEKDEGKEIGDHTKASAFDSEEMCDGLVDSNVSLFGIDHSLIQKKIQNHKKEMRSRLADLDQTGGSDVDDISKNFQQFYKDMKQKKTKKAKSTLRREGRSYRGELDEMVEVDEMKQDEQDMVWDDDVDVNNVEAEAEFLQSDDYDGYAEDDECEGQSEGRQDAGDPNHGRGGKV